MNNTSNLIEEMNAIDVKERVDKDTIAILIFVACENHGDNMPFGSDFIFPLELSKRISSKIRNTIIFPPIPYGVSLHHDSYQLTMSLRNQTLIYVIEDLLNSLIKHKIKNIFIINGHDGNISPIEIASRNIKNVNPEITIACIESWWTLVGQINPNLFKIWHGLGHGGEGETSAMLAVRPDLVNLNNASEETIPNLPKYIRIYWNFDELTNSGSTGAPRKATPQKGNTILTILEKEIISFLLSMESTSWKYGKCLN